LVPGEVAQNTTLDHEDRRPIDVVIGWSHGKRSATISPHDISKEDVIDACRIARERLRASVARSEEVDVLERKLVRFGVR